MDYRLYELRDTDFENLIITICQEILGMGTISFSEGKDGGKDGKFEGKANLFPSKQEQWNGKFIIQVKHTTKPIASCSDSDFKTTVKKEIEKLEKLKANNEIDNYLLFTNRKYSGISGESLLNEIKKEIQIENVAIIGLETINSYLASNYKIVKQYKLNEPKIPLNFSYDDFKVILIEFSNIIQQSKSEKEKYDFKRPCIEYKNEINKLSTEYWEDEIVKKSFLEFQLIKDFLEDPINEEYKGMYFDIAYELSNIITINRKSIDKFEVFFNKIYNEFIENDNTNLLRSNKKYIYYFLHYMYYSCDIGKKDND